MRICIVCTLGSCCRLRACSSESSFSTALSVLGPGWPVSCSSFSRMAAHSSRHDRWDGSGPTFPAIYMSDRVVHRGPNRGGCRGPNRGGWQARGCDAARGGPSGRGHCAPYGNRGLPDVGAVRAAWHHQGCGPGRPRGSTAHSPSWTCRRRRRLLRLPVHLELALLPRRTGKHVAL